jgi:hypothetical protein
MADAKLRALPKNAAIRTVAVPWEAVTTAI